MKRLFIHSKKSGCSVVLLRFDVHKISSLIHHRFSQMVFDKPFIFVKKTIQDFINAKSGDKSFETMQPFVDGLLWPFWPCSLTSINRKMDHNVVQKGWRMTI
jgi:hypothetical protein